MKKVLILAYDFPPYVSVGGLRPYAWLKYLPEYGVEPIVVTRSWSNDYGNGLDYVAASSSANIEIDELPTGLVIRTPYAPTLSNRLLLKYGSGRFRLLRKSLTAWAEITQFLWVTGTKKELYYAAEEFLSENKVDAIIATGDPFVLFKYASLLSRKFKIPWISDYRDLWSQFYSTSKLPLLKTLDSIFEKRIVKSASAITTVSSFLEGSLLELFPDNLLQVLPNGFDPEAIAIASQIPQNTDKLTISFVGSIYPWHAWESFIAEFSRILETNRFDIDLYFIGVNIAADIECYVDGLPEKSARSIHVLPKLANTELLSLIATHNVLLLFNYYAFMGTKIYDYIGVNRKILFCYTNDPESNRLKKAHYLLQNNPPTIETLQVDLLREKDAGIIIDNIDGLEQALIDLVMEFDKNKRIHSSVHNRDDLSRKGQVAKLAKLIQTITEKK